MVRPMSATTKKRPAKKPRLSRADWLRAGFQTLAARGPTALKVDALAADLGATKGSFYWHFKDLPDFEGKLLADWEAQCLAAIETTASGDSQPASRLRALTQLLASREDSAHTWQHAEPSIRAWARGSALASATLGRVDAHCLDALSRLLGACGVTNPDLTRAIYASAIGMADLSIRDNQSNDAALGTLVDLVLALR